MSKIGSKPVDIDTATVTLNGKVCTVVGPRGTLTVEVPRQLTAEVVGTQIILKRVNESASARALHGLTRSLIANAVQGVTRGWEKKLEIVGTGFGVSIKEGAAVFKVGYSHQVTVPPVVGLTFSIDGPSLLIISGADKQLIGQEAHKVRLIRPPDPYKGKGIRYQGEVVKLKPGKKAKTA